MNTQVKKLKINVKGAFHKLWAKTVFKRRIKTLGVKVEFVRHNSIHHTEVVITGETDKLWKAIEMIKSPSYLLKMDKVAFEFTDF